MESGMYQKASVWRSEYLLLNLGGLATMSPGSVARHKAAQRRGYALRQVQG